MQHITDTMKSVQNMLAFSIKVTYFELFRQQNVRFKLKSGNLSGNNLCFILCKFMQYLETYVVFSLVVLRQLSYDNSQFQLTCSIEFMEKSPRYWNIFIVPVSPKFGIFIRSRA